MGNVPMTDAERERQWRAEEDARILKRAHEIMNDKGRHKDAKSHLTKELKALQSAVGKKPTAPKAPAKKATAPKGKKK